MPEIRMIKLALFALGVIVAVGVLGSLMAPAQAAPAYQLTEFPTPTPGPDGRILYTVQDGDTLWRISAVSGVSLDELRQLNNLSADAVIRPGQVLLLGLAQAPRQTSEPVFPGGQEQPQTTPTPTGMVDASAICALLYLDVNGNGIREETEIALADGEVSVTERLGAFSEKNTTSFQDEPVCFENIPPGEYIITMALPGGMNRTTNLNVTVQLMPGDTSFVNFGAQPAGPFPTISGGVEEGSDGGSGSLIAILGITMLVAGVGVGIWAAVGSRRRFSSE